MRDQPLIPECSGGGREREEEGGEGRWGGSEGRGGVDILIPPRLVRSVGAKSFCCDVNGSMIRFRKGRGNGETVARVARANTGGCSFGGGRDMERGRETLTFTC